MEITLAELATKIGAELRGAPDYKIMGVATLADADVIDVSFFHNAKYHAQLKTTRAGAVILSTQAAKYYEGNALICEEPYFAYAQVASLFQYHFQVNPGIHATAIIGKDCSIDSTASIGAYAVIGDHVRIGANTMIGANSVIEDYCEVGNHSRIDPRVTLHHHVQVGSSVHIFSGAVIGSEGFGHVMHKGSWCKVPQLGAVIIEDDVEIGANTTIDRGALGNTKISRGARLDNQIQIAHNVVIGEYTAIAAGAGIAGSAKVGAYCMIGGNAGINGHIEVTDRVLIVGMSAVANSIKKPGIYASGTGLMPMANWRKMIARLRQLDGLVRDWKRMIRTEDREK